VTGHVAWAKAKVATMKNLNVVDAIILPVILKK